MGKVLVPAKIENLQDLYQVKLGALDQSKVRSLEVADALVDTGASMLSIPKRLIAGLGIDCYRTRRVRTTAGVVDSHVYEAVRLTIQGRDCTMDVAEVADDCPVLIGQLPLEALDFVIDPMKQKLIGNPEHGGEHMIELL